MAHTLGKKIAIVTDAWHPQINGVVRTLSKTAETLKMMGFDVRFITPESFSTIPCPMYKEIRLSLFAKKGVFKALDDYRPDYLHISTEGPLGLAARAYASAHNLAFTTAFHTRFPEYVRARLPIPLSLTYAFLRWFHKPSHAVMVPTPSILSDLKAWELPNLVIWSRGVDLTLFNPSSHKIKNKKPVFINVGRVAIEKNLEAFLKLDLPGEKWVVGGGPDLAILKKRYPEVLFFGPKPMEELPDIYNLADVFVFPSKSDTFGLVLLEAMACGLPVAAYPVAGPIDVVGASKGGVLDEDLQKACMKALKVNSKEARSHVEQFSWEASTRAFANHLVLTHHQDEAQHPKETSFKIAAE